MKRKGLAYIGAVLLLLAGFGLGYLFFQWYELRHCVLYEGKAAFSIVGASDQGFREVGR